MGSSKSSAEVPSSGGDTGAESRSTQPASVITDGSLQNPTRRRASGRETKTHGSTSDLVNGHQNPYFQGASTSTSDQENAGVALQAPAPAVSASQPATEGFNNGVSSLQPNAANQLNGAQPQCTQTVSSVLENSKHVGDHPATTPGNNFQTDIPFWKKVKDFFFSSCCCKWQYVYFTQKLSFWTQELLILRISNFAVNGIDFWEEIMYCLQILTDHTKLVLLYSRQHVQCSFIF